MIDRDAELNARQALRGLPAITEAQKAITVEVTYIVTEAQAAALVEVLRRYKIVEVVE